jgi:hypothetical protein
MHFGESGVALHSIGQFQRIATGRGEHKARVPSGWGLELRLGVGG